MSNQAVSNQYSAYYLRDTVQDQINQLEASVAFSSGAEPAPRTITLWDNPRHSGATGIYPDTNNRGATLTCGIYISPTNGMTGITSMCLTGITGPGPTGSIWLKQSDNCIYHNDVNLETTGSGDVVGPASSVTDTLPVFDGTSGKLLKNSVIAIEENGILAEYLSLSGSTYTNTALVLPSAVGSSNTLVQIGPSRFIGLSKNATTSVSIGLGCGGSQVGNGCYGFGYEVLYSGQTAAVDDTAMGSQSMRTATTAKRCSAFGRSSLYSLTTGEDDIAIGYEAGSAYTTESGNICIDHDGVPGDAGVIRIGTAQTKNFQKGIVGITTDVNDAIPVVIDSNGQLGTVSSSIKKKENIKDLTGSEIIYSLRPVEFNYTDHSDKSKSNIGLIAEEVEKVYPDGVIYHPNNETGDLEIHTVDYSRLSILLLKEVQTLNSKYNQLSQQIRLLTSQLSSYRAASPKYSS